MKNRNVFATITMIVVVLIAGCAKTELADMANIESPEPQFDIAMAGPSPVNLGSAGKFVILSKSGITNVFPSSVTGNIGSSPITGAAILLSCVEVTGSILSVDAAGPLPCSVASPSKLTNAVGAMQTAYVDAAGRVDPDFLNLGAGTIGGLTFTPGLYKWTSAVNMPTDITISGGPTDVWIFQISGTLTVGTSVNVTLIGGAKAKNIFWQTIFNYLARRMILR